MLTVVGSVLALRAGRWRKQADALVIPDGFDVDTRTVGQFADQEGPGSRFCVHETNDLGLASVVATDITLRRSVDPEARCRHGTSKEKAMMTRFIVVSAMLVAMGATVYAACPFCP